MDNYNLKIDILSYVKKHKGILEIFVCVFAFCMLVGVILGIKTDVNALFEKGKAFYVKYLIGKKNSVFFNIFLPNALFVGIFVFCRKNKILITVAQVITAIKSVIFIKSYTIVLIRYGFSTFIPYLLLLVFEFIAYVTLLVFSVKTYEIGSTCKQNPDLLTVVIAESVVVCLSSVLTSIVFAIIKSIT